MNQGHRSQAVIHAEIVQLQQRIKSLEDQLTSPLSTDELSIDTALPSENYLSAQRFSTLLDTASIAIIVAGHDGKIRTANQKASEIFDYSGNELVGSPVSILLPEHLRETHEQHLNRFFANPRPRPMGQGMDLMAQRKDGSRFPILVEVIQADARIYYQPGKLHFILDEGAAFVGLPGKVIYEVLDTAAFVFHHEMVEPEVIALELGTYLQQVVLGGLAGYLRPCAIDFRFAPVVGLHVALVQETHQLLLVVFQSKPVGLGDAVAI
jgi:PAS domain S-box-containing protein